MVDLTKEQQSAFDAIMAFIATPYNPGKPWFCLQGGAGTGKSTVLTRVAHAAPWGRLSALTGKASSVLARKSGLRTSTIHDLIYQFTGENAEGDPTFQPKWEKGDLHGTLALVDEVSMIDEWLAGDLIDTGCKIVATGDPGQLPPVMGRQFFKDADITLSEIHRQAWDSPIIRQAWSVRSGFDYFPDGDNFRVVQMVDHQDIVDADIMLCWMNVTRQQLNFSAREHRGLPRDVILAGEPVMKLKRNHHENGTLNGAIYRLTQDYLPNTRHRISLINERGEEVTIRRAWLEGFEEQIPDGDDPSAFALGYAATVHKAQGSEWSTVVLIDEYDRADQRSNFMYTGITRSSERIVIQRPWAYAQ